MNWEVIAAIAQLLAAIAVVPTLVYLAIQVRNQNKESRRAAANAFVLHYNDFRKSLSDNSELASILLRGAKEFEDLDPNDKLRFGALMGRVFVLSQGLYYFYLDGILAPDLWRTFEQATADLAAYPGVRAWWATRQHWHTPAFRSLVDQMIAEGRKPTLYERYTKHLGDSQ